MSTRYSTLLIHGPGGVPGVISRIPLATIVATTDNEFTSAYESYGSDSETIYKNGKQRFLSGNQLGGSQLISGNVWSGGKTADFEEWRQLGAEGFDRDTLYKFSRLHSTGQFENVSAYEVGDRGEIAVSHPDVFPEFKDYHESWVEAGARITGGTVMDNHNTDTLSFGRIMANINQTSGYVSNPVRSFIEPLLGGKLHRSIVRNNLHILLYSTVTKVNMDTSGEIPEAKSVSVEVRNKKGKVILTKVIKATRKIILSAGALRSPQLLMVSGIGDKEILSKLGVKTLVHRPGVGGNLHNHPTAFTPAVCFPKKGKGYVDLGLSDLLQYVANRTGKLRSTAGLTSVAFFSSRNPNLSTCPDTTNAQTCRPDFEVFLYTAATNSQIGYKMLSSMGVPHQTIVKHFYLANKESKKRISKFDTYFKQVDCINFIPLLLHPEERGTIVLSSKNIYDKPLVNLSFNSNSRDVQLHTELYLITEKISDEAFKKFGGEFIDLRLKECDMKRHDKRMYAECVIRKVGFSGYHLSGTCRIGREDDDQAVVDSNFNVIGVNHLSVVDASVFPSPLSGHMLLTIASVAEKAACMFLAEAQGAKCVV